MKLKTLAVITLVLFTCSLVFAAGPSKSLGSGKGSAWGSGQMKGLHQNGAQYAYWYFTGEFDPNAPNGLANGLFNSTTNFGVDGIVDVPFENPGVANTIVDIAILELVIGGTTGNNGGYWEVRDGNVSSGNSGTLFKSGACKSVSSFNTGATGFGLPIYQMDCQLKKAVKLKAGVSYWVAYEPNFNDGSYGYLANVEDVPPPFHYGGADEFENSFFTSTYFAEFFEPTATDSGSLSPYGDEFSIGLAH